jgi:hypothetical protein
MDLQKLCRFFMSNRSDPVSDPNPDRLLWMRIRIRRNDTDPQH